MLAYEAIDGRSLDRLEADEMTDDAARPGVGRSSCVLRSHRVAHRDLRLANVFMADDGEAWIIDFGFSELAASDLLLATDLAELTASLATVVGAERALAAGRRAVGDAGHGHGPARACSSRCSAAPPAPRSRRSPVASTSCARWWPARPLTDLDQQCGRHEVSGIRTRCSSPPMSRPVPRPAVTSSGLWAPT